MLDFRKIISQQSSARQSPKFYLKFDEKNPNILEQYHSSKTRRSVYSNVSPATLQSERSPKEIKSNYRQSPQDFTQRKTPNNLYSKSLNQGLQIKKPNSTSTMVPGAKTLHKQKSKEHTKGKSQDVFDPKGFQNFLEKSTKSKSLTGVQSYREIGSKSPIDFFGLEKSSSIENPSIVLDRKRSDLVLSNSRSLVSTALNTKIHSQMVSPKVGFPFFY